MCVEGKECEAAIHWTLANKRPTDVVHLLHAVRILAPIDVEDFNETTHVIDFTKDNKKIEDRGWQTLGQRTALFKEGIRNHQEKANVISSLVVTEDSWEKALLESIHEKNCNLLVCGIFILIS